MCLVVPEGAPLRRVLDIVDAGETVPILATAEVRRAASGATRVDRIAGMNAATTVTTTPTSSATTAASAAVRRSS
jgi:hypothetical protein